MAALLNTSAVTLSTNLSSSLVCVTGKWTPPRRSLGVSCRASASSSSVRTTDWIPSASSSGSVPFCIPVGRGSLGTKAGAAALRELLSKVDIGPVFGTNSLDRGSSVIRFPVLEELEEEMTLLSWFEPLARENSGVEGLRFVVMPVVEGESVDVWGFEGLNSGAEGLSLVFGGGESSGLMGLIDDDVSLSSMSLLGEAGGCGCSIFLASPLIREAAAAALSRSSTSSN